MRRLMLVSLAFVLTACSGASSTAPSGDPCDTSINADIASRGTPTSRTDNGDTTTLHWGATFITYTRQDASDCFVSYPQH